MTQDVRDSNDIFYMAKEYSIIHKIVLGGSFLSSTDNASLTYTDVNGVLIRFNISLSEINTIKENT